MKNTQNTHREQHVLLILIDSSGVGDGVGVFEDGHGLPRQNGLVHPERGGADGRQPDVRRDFIAN